MDDVFLAQNLLRVLRKGYRFAWEKQNACMANFQLTPRYLGPTFFNARFSLINKVPT